jgi:hypothetical protein
MSKKLTRLQIEEIVRNMLAKHLLEGKKKDHDGDGDIDSDDYLAAKDKAIKGAMQTEGSGDRNDKDREQGHGKQRQRAASDGSKGELEEKFHACAAHVKENRTGREGRPINHTLLEDGTVTHYDVEFVNEIVTGIPSSELTILELNEHMHSANRDDYPHGDKTRLKHMKEDDGDVGGLPAPGQRKPVPMPAAGTERRDPRDPKPVPMPAAGTERRDPRDPKPVDMPMGESKSDKEWYGDSLYGRLLKEWTKK